MTKQELWAFYLSKNPSFGGDTPITLSPAGLHKLFDQTWERAWQDGFENGAAKGAAGKGSAPDLFNEMFGDTFGGKRK
jgi:hypothetical protein